MQLKKKNANNVFVLLIVFASFNLSVASKIIWNRRKIRRYELGLDLVLYKAGGVRVVVVLQLQRQNCLLIAGLQFLFITVKHVDSYSCCVSEIF